MMQQKKSNQKRNIKYLAIAGVVLLLLSILLSIAYGAKAVDFQDVILYLMGKHPDSYISNVIKARLPRTFFGILAGMSLSISGLLMQSVTRNPIADPSILGVNTGAALFIVSGISFFHIQSKISYMGFAFIGGIVTAVFVYRLASLGSSGATPIKLAISGAAISTAFSSIISMIVMPDSTVMNTYRFWQIGSIGGTSFGDILLLLPFTAIALIISLLLSTNLDTMLLSEETARSLGLPIRRTRILAAFCGVLLCACTTALAGPISFLGLMIPHFIRALTGANHRVMILLCGIYGSSILILSDVLGRRLGAPGELESGIMTALLGAPVFVYIIRKAKLQSL